MAEVAITEAEMQFNGGEPIVARERNGRSPVIKSGHHKGPLTDEQKDQVVRFYTGATKIGCYSVQAISGVMGISRERVNEVLDDNGIERRRVRPLDSNFGPPAKYENTPQTRKNRFVRILLNDPI